MPIRNMIASIRYKENCNYEASETQCNVLVPTQDIDISYNIVNIDYPRRNVMDFAPTNDRQYFYNDTLYLYVGITCNGISVQSGSVNIYYIPYNYDRFDFPKPLNKEPLLVDNNGNVAIAYKPHTNGSFIIEYNGDQNYNNGILETSQIIVEDIPTLLNFTKQHPYFANVKDTVDMEVKVTDIYDNPVDYGVVTFINYLRYNIEDANDGREHIIGNPVLVSDGYAKIKYSPIQAVDADVNVYYNPATDSIGYLHNNERDMNVIMVSEDNYDSLTSYIFPSEFDEAHMPCLMYYRTGENYLHFIHDSDFELVKTKVELIKGVYNYDNAIYGTKWKYYLRSSDMTNIAFLQPDALNLNIISENGRLTVDDDEFIHTQYGDYLKLEAKLLDVEGNYVPLETSEIEFIVKGTKVVVVSDTLTNDHNANVEENYRYIPYEKTFRGVYMEEFGSDTNVFVGNITELLSPGYYTIYAHLDMTKNAEEEDITHTGSAYGNIKNKEYYRQVDSEKIYIQVEQDKTNYEITVTECPSDVGIRNVISPVTVEIAINEEYHPALIGKTCWFYIDRLNQEYATTIQKVNGRLVATLSEPISFGEAGDYAIYAYIKEGDYIYGNRSVHLYKKCSETKILKARYNLVPEFNIQTIRDIFSGKAKVNATVNNIYTTENPVLNVAISKDSVDFVEETYELDSSDNSISIDLNDLEAGFYEVRGKVGIEKIVGENSVVIYGQEMTETFEIRKATLTDYNDNIRDMPTHPAQSVVIKLNTNGTGFRTLDYSKVKVILESDRGYRECSFTINENIITARCPLYRIGEYSIRAKYEGSDNFYVLDDEPRISFNAVTVRGQMLMSRNEDGDLLIQIHYNNGLHNGQYIYGTLTLYNFNGNSIQLPVLFGSTGTLRIQNVVGSDYQWQQYYRGELELNPYDDIIINKFLDDEMEVITDSVANVPMIKAQIQDLEKEALFTTYGEQIINGEVNGINGNQ